ncbi:g3733 [Coccomyxa viridis]|uniref:G3733 protein n=1 Tax=Coccomyxa viridis TaxID=1274662 RepID=A0ABP1FNI4_9CHLO
MPLLAAEQHDDSTGVAQEDVQHTAEPPSDAYRASSEKLWPTSRNQKKYGARVRDALHTVMMDSGGAAYARLVWQLGFTIVEVRMSPDNMTAFVLWDAHDDSLFSAEREIGYRLSQLRRDIGRLLGMRHTPRLEFRLDRLSQEQQDVEDAFERLRADR